MITGALERLGDKAKQIQPVFVSIDPGRDKPAVMKDYVSNFYPGMIGLTGSPEQIAKVAKLYRVYYSKAAEKGAAEDEYTMDHSSIVYLMGPNGEFLKHFSYGTDAEKLAKGLEAAISN
ncbi:MAG TPA: SCO family protein [Rhizobiales bacterium]|nr:SCO family protein [Hyphomicrobiales bacterium]